MQYQVLIVLFKCLLFLLLLIYLLDLIAQSTAQAKNRMVNRKQEEIL